MEIELPKSGNAAESEKIIINQKLVLIGANGSGKSRLGAWLEAKYGEKGWRITAQKSLEIPDAFTFSSEVKAYNQLAYGNENWTLGNRSANKYASNPTGKNVTDFEGLLKLLYAKDAVHAKVVRTAAESNQYSKEHFEPSQLQRLKSIWENILPHRQLDIELTGELKTKQTTTAGAILSYMSSGMSDGERVMFYLLGKCLVAPEGAVLIIDEPEVHLHPTVRDALWASIEAERSDCTFIYITHDISFACGRMEDQAVWLKAFDGVNWEWTLVSQTEGIPADLTLELLGSRKRILFVEGEKNKTDHHLYSALYPDFHVIPCGGCEQVAQYVGATEHLRSFHNLKPVAIIDADNRTEDEINKLKEKQIYTLKAAEIENLFWCPEVLAVMEELEEGENSETKAKSLVLKSITDRLDAEILPALIKKIIQKQLTLSKVKDITAIKTQLLQLSALNVDAEVDLIRSKITDAILNKNWSYLLQKIEKKSLPRDIAEIYRFKADGYIEKVLTHLRSKDKAKQEKMRSAFSKYTPQLPLAN